MAATVVTIADAIVSAVEAGTFAEDVRVQRTWTAQMDLSELQEATEPKLTVLPAQHTQAPYTRDRAQWADHVTVDVGIRARCLDAARADELAALTEEILDHLRENINDQATLPLREARTDPLFDDETLATYQVWFAVLRFTFGLSAREAD